jgi:hypothetical protein
MPEDKLGLFRRLVIDRYERRIVASAIMSSSFTPMLKLWPGHCGMTATSSAETSRPPELYFMNECWQRAADEAQELWERIGIGSWPSLQPPADRRKWQGAPPKLHRKGTPFIPRAELAKEAKLQERAF